MKPALVLALAWAVAGHAAAGPADDEADARKMLDEYVVSYASLDAHRVAAYFDEPYMNVTADGARVMATHADVEATMKAFFPQLKARGYGHSEIASLRAKALDDGLVLASARIIRRKTDGSELATLGATYLLRRTADGWRIAVITNHRASTAPAIP